MIPLLKSQWDRAAAILLSVAGVIALVAGYVGVADSAILAEQTRYIVSGGIGGIFLLGLGATLWISADLRDEWRKLDRIEHALADGVLKWADPSDPPADEPAKPAANGIAHPVELGLTSVVPSRDHA